MNPTMLTAERGHARRRVTMIQSNAARRGDVSSESSGARIVEARLTGSHADVDAPLEALQRARFQLR